MDKIDTILGRIYKKLDIKNDADFCKRYDIRPNTLSNWKNRNTIALEKILDIARKEKISIDYILLGKDNEKNTHNVNNDGYHIRVLSHNVSAGTSSDIDGIDVFDTKQKIFIPRDLFKFPVKEDKLRMTQVVGDSMLPKLHPGDWVILDITENFVGDGLYVINYNNILMVKMLQVGQNGNMCIRSLNPEYSSYELKSDTQEIFYVLGRVIKSIT